MDFSNVSHHMSRKLQILLPQLASSRQITQNRASSIDLSIAENVLLEEQILTMVKEAVETSPTLNVNCPNSVFYQMLIGFLGSIVSRWIWGTPIPSHSPGGFLQHIFQTIESR